jgi:hypothetical protein
MPNSKARALSILAFVIPMAGIAQTVSNSNFGAMIGYTNGLMQNSISQIMASQAATKGGSSSSGPPPGWCDPMPPYQLQRGMKGEVPPELQGDPRYQAWLRCHQGQSAPQATAANNVAPATRVTSSGGKYPTPVVSHHLPITATDFTPAVHGHPFLEQYLRSQPFTAGQRAELSQAFAQMSARVARENRPNNLATSMAVAVCGAIYTIDNGFTDADSGRYLIAINDRIAVSPQFASMSPLQKQNLSDSLILQTTVIKLLKDLGQTDPQAKMQSTQLAHTMLQNLTGSPTGRLSF